MKLVPSIAFLLVAFTTTSSSTIPVVVQPDGTANVVVDIPTAPRPLTVLGQYIVANPSQYRATSELFQLQL